jgi:methionyl-tRNA synthetase
LGNKYLADQEPWKLINEDPERVETIINTALQIAACLTVLSEPLLPFTAIKMKSMLNIDLSWDEVSTCKNPLITAGMLLGKPELLFSKIEDDKIKIQLEKLKLNT